MNDEVIAIEVGDVVEVLWDDAACWYMESTPEDWGDEFNVLTVGYVVGMTEKSIFIASEIQVENDTYRGVTRLPKTYIQNIKLLSKTGQKEADA